MIGPEVLARSMSKPSVVSRDGSVWQYHSRSDDHSKKACWLVVFDLMLNCPLLRQHVYERKVYFGINHEMRDFQQNRKKDLDLVLCTGAAPPNAEAKSLTEMADDYGVLLDARERTQLAELPELARAPVGSVLVALEAKACMTEHIKARPRLYDELNSSHLTIHGATDEAIAAGLVIINYADSFVSPGKNPASSSVIKRNQHQQPRVTSSVIEKVGEIPRRSSTGRQGFDALSIIVVDCSNDGSPVRLITGKPAPQPNEVMHYSQMIHRLAHLYSTRFSLL